MPDPLEQRLRDALEARANQVTPGDLDRVREQEMRDRLSRPPEEPPAPTPLHSRRAAKVTAAGLVAAAALGAGVVISQFGDDTTVRPQADPATTLPPQSTSSTAAPSTGASERQEQPAQTGDDGERRQQDPATQTQQGEAATPAPQQTPGGQTDEQQQEAPSSSAPQDQESEQQAETSTPSDSASSESDESETAAPYRMMERFMSTSSASSTSEATAASSASPKLAVHQEADRVDVQVGAAGRARVADGASAITSWRVHFGDGASSGESVSSCDSDAPTKSFDEGDGTTHTYGDGGSYQLTAVVTYCGDNGPTSVTTSRTVSVP